MRVLAAAAALLLAAPAAAQVGVGTTSPILGPRPAAAVDWVRHVERTAEGGYRAGNPDAPVKLVEYGSVTCSHCAEFAEASRSWLPAMIRSGRVSFEYRPHLLFPTDPGIFLLLGCQDAGAFFRSLDQLYATQAQWSGRLQQLPEARIRALSNLSPQRQAAAVVKAVGADAHFRRGGMSPARIDRCLADPAGQQALARAHELGVAAGVTGTPTFFINGRRADIGSWADLERMLNQS